jgi:hypothetical protein
MKKQFSTSSTPAEVKGAIDKILEIMDARLYELGEQYNTGMGTTKDPMTLMHPVDQDIYFQLKGEKPPFTGVPGRGAGAPATGGQETSAQKAKRLGLR